MKKLINTTWSREAVERETAKAYLFNAGNNGVTIFAKDRMVWVPKSAVEWIDVKPYGEMAHIPAWLARKL